jgi:GTPase
MTTARTTYAIRVDGHLDDHWSAWLGALDLTRDDDGSTTVTISVADQAQLHGVLAGLRDIGAILTELRILGAPAPTGDQATCSSRR